MFEKLREAALAYQLERHWDKDKILTEYLNEIYFGEGAYGIEAAAHSFFQTNAHDLTLAQASMLAGLPQAPTQYNPLINLPAAKERQLTVLTAMVDNHFITQPEADAAYAVKLQIYPPTNHFLATYFVDYVLKTLRQQYHIEPGDRHGYRVYSSLDLNLQSIAESQAYFGRLGMVLNTPQPETLVDTSFTQAALKTLGPGAPPVPPR